MAGRKPLHVYMPRVRGIHAGNDAHNRSPNQKSSGMEGQEDLQSIHQEQSEVGLLRPLLKAEGREKDLDCTLVPFIVGCFL